MVFSLVQATDISRNKGVLPVSYIGTTYSKNSTGTDRFTSGNTRFNLL